MAAQFNGGQRIPGPLGCSFGGGRGRVPGPSGLLHGQKDSPVGTLLSPATALTRPQASSSLSSLPPIVLSVLNGMDVQGETILGTYLYGGGVPHDIEDANWTAYMTAHQVLAGQILMHLRPLVQAIADRKNLGQYPIFDRFHA